MLQVTALKAKHMEGIGNQDCKPKIVTIKVAQVSQREPKAGRYRLRGSKITKKIIDRKKAGQTRAKRDL